MCRLCVLFCLLWLLLACCEGRRNLTAVEAVIRQREALVEEIVARAEELFNDRQRAVQSCTCSRHDCANNFGPDNVMECTSELLFETCEEDCGERLVNYNKTVVRTPLGINPQLLSGSHKQSICTYAGLEEDFKNVKLKHGLSNSWTYVGFQDGHFRTWPLRARGRNPSNNDPFLDECKAYDPRRRPWYSAASTGPKDVVLLVDTSVSTLASSGQVGQSTSLWACAQQALLSILDTFSFADYVNVVMFSSTADALWTQSALAEANPGNREILKGRVRRAVPSGATNIAAGFETTTDLFIASHREGSSANCNKIILFMTEGPDTQLKTSEVLMKIEEQQTRLEAETGSRAYVFTYSLGPDSDESLAQQIACAHQGLWSPIRHYKDPLTDMNNYLETIATTRGQEGSIWVDPYDDAGGLGIVTTVSMPVFSRGREGELPLLLGVVGHDVKLDDLVVGGYDAESVLQKLVERTKKCQSLNLKPCDLQVRRYIQSPHTQCADVYPERLCYQFEDYWYRRFTETISQHHAKAFCETKNGTLAPVRSADHLRFLSAIASPDKSWLGGRRSLGVDPIEFAFDDVDIVPIDQYNDGWAVRQPGNPRETCMIVDRRSISGNLESVSCESAFDFICEFQSPQAAGCGENSLRVTDDENGELKTFTMPHPLECPQMERARRDAQPVQEAEDMMASDVICDFGPPVYHEELYCCVDCFNTSLHTSNAFHISITWTLFFLSFLICGIIL